MPAATPTPAVKTEKEEQLWTALKRHILRERQRKKEEQEAEVEEERLRKEREAREKQDEMTLGETREQIQLFGNKLEELKNEKKQLFLKLKKVLNEDDNRKRQLHKESNELFAIHNMQTQQNVQQSQIFLPPRLQQQQLLANKNSVQIIGSNQHLKRGRSPSPTQGYYKTSNSQQYQQSPKHEEGRRGGEPNRAVLWNKPTQYPSAPGTLFYPNAPTNSPDSRSHSIVFSQYANINIPIRQNYIPEMSQSAANAPPQKSDKPPPPQGNVYHINLDPPPQQSQQQQQQPGQVLPPSHKSIPQGQVTMEKLNERGGYHIEIKHDDRKDVRASQPSQTHMTPDGLVYTNSIRHIPIHAGVMPIAQNPGNKPPTGSITQGYPNRPSNLPPPQQMGQQVHYPRHRY